MNTEEKIKHVEAINHILHQAELFIIKGNFGYNHTYHYRINDKRYQIHMEIKEESD